MKNDLSVKKIRDQPLIPFGLSFFPFLNKVRKRSKTVMINGRVALGFCVLGGVFAFFAKNKTRHLVGSTSRTNKAVYRFLGVTTAHQTRRKMLGVNRRFSCRIFYNCGRRKFVISPTGTHVKTEIFLHCCRKVKTHFHA